MNANPRVLWRAFKTALTSLYVLFFLNGFLLCFIVYSFFEDQYEQETFRSLHAYVVKSIKTRPVSEDSVLLRSLHLVYSLQAMHREVFSSARMGGFMANDFEPVSFDFMTGQGACGSASLVLGRLLSGHYPVRFAHMTAGGREGAHQILEVKLHNRWVVLDPLYDLYFIRPDGRMASFEDVRRSWSWYKRQVPKGYDMRYDYSGVVYTNWNKIPVLMPAIKAGLNLALGKKRADTVSLRAWFLRKFHCLFIVLLAVQALVLLYTLRRLHARRKARRAGLYREHPAAYSYMDAVLSPTRRVVV